MWLERHAHPVFLVLRLGLGVFFLWVGGEKLFRLDDFVQDVANYKIVYPPLDALVGYFLPWVEVFAGLGLIVGLLYRGALLTVVALSLAFMGGLGSAWLRGLEINCGCFGASDEPTSYPLHLALNAGIILVAGLLAWEHRRGVQAADQPARG